MTHLTPLAHALHIADQCSTIPASLLMRRAKDASGQGHYVLPNEYISLCRTITVTPSISWQLTSYDSYCEECERIAKRVRQHRSAQGTARMLERKQDEQVQAFLQQVDEGDPHMRVAIGVWQHVSGRGRVVPDHVMKTLRTIIKRSL